MSTLLWAAFCVAIALGLMQRRHYEAEMKWRDKANAQLFEIVEDWANHCEHRGASR